MNDIPKKAIYQYWVSPNTKRRPSLLGLLPPQASVVGVNRRLCKRTKNKEGLSS